MIKETMNQQEIGWEIVTDYPKVQKKAMYLTESMRRKAIKLKNKFPHTVIEYESPQNNKWLIFIFYLKKELQFKCIVQYFDKEGFKAIVVEPDGTLVIFSSNFFQSYNIQYLQQPELSETEVLKHFIINQGAWLVPPKT